ncbi:MAG: PVC-type heme-binding CxxCH protein [Verrucomicrobiales bacterium]
MQSRSAQEMKQLTLAVSLITLATSSGQHTLSTFTKHVLNENFFSEGACFADIDADGHQDVVSGPYWYAGPAFEEKHAYTTTQRFPIAVYSRHFFSFAHDFNDDGRLDILAIPIPGEPAHWFENPGARSNTHWQKHLAFEWVGNESPTLTDLTGDGHPELILCYQGKLGYAKPNSNKPTEPWTFTAITGDRGFGRFTHGLGVGDVNNDGRLDILETNGWWEQPAEKGAFFKLHPVRFAESGGAQMFTDDVDTDGDQDIVSVQNAHGYGLCWFEQIGDDTEPQFQRHAILTDKPADSPYGLSMSQMHATALVDIDGDGRKDIVTGKRYWAHGGNDPGSQELPLLYWFKNSSTADGVYFEPWLIDERSGVGTQLTVGDVSGNGFPDIVIGNKLGTFVFTQTRQEVTAETYEGIRPQKREALKHVAGTDAFAQQVRTTEPLLPEEEKKCFVLPAGFKVELVAAEPDIAKPMNMAFDTRGRLWVTSSTEYPNPAPDNRTPQDTIKILEDTNGDGRADNITTFADGLNIPIGLYPYDGGVICFSIPYVWDLRDTDGDDRCDLREKLYGPFDCSRDTHGMCNSFTGGLDGWLYACHGFNNQSTVAGKDGHIVTLQSGNIFRMRLDGSRIEHVSHGQVNPFGMTFDRHGDLLTADCHTKPISLIMHGGYHESFGKPHDGLGFVPNVMEHLHRSTGIAGIALGEDSHFPEAYQSSTFGGNVVTSRINRNRLLHRGSTVVAEEESDFLISEDPWFRPVDLQVSPDGALYVADFYNSIIGHYEVPLDHPKRDRHRGRIWKITHQEPTTLRKTEDGTTQTYRHFAEHPEDLPEDIDLLAEAPITQRAAVMAIAAAKPSAKRVSQLLNWRRQVAQDDKHLQHAFKIALKHHLTDPKTFSTAQVADEDVQVVADICLALKHPQAAEFLVAHLEQLPSERLNTYLKFAARSTSLTALPKVVLLARTRFETDLYQQRELLLGIREGLTQRGINFRSNNPQLALIKAWASDLAKEWLGISDDPDLPIQWTSSNNTWTTTTSRVCADGQKGALLWSSFPKGETKTGRHRSDTFPLGHNFTFYLAGHDGPPSNPLQGKNAVRLRRAKDDRILHTAKPPRNDVAQELIWDTTTHQGTDAYVELIDGDDGVAYAWLAVGRFSIANLNPNHHIKKQILAAELIRDLHLTEFKTDLEQLLKTQSASAPLAQAYVSLVNKATAISSILSKALEIQTQDRALKQRTFNAILSGDANTVLADWMNALPKAHQTRLAEICAATNEGASQLLDLVQFGNAPASLLQAPTVDSLLDKNLTKAQLATKEQLLADLPDEDEALEKLIATRIQSYRSQGGAVAAGQALFQKHCSICHQLGGAGTVLGPNLDGIGGRSLARLTEDILNPSRNVDIAFRLTTLTTKNGNTHIGLIKRTEGTQTILADPTGNESSIPTKSITEKTALTLSLMPPTFADALTKVEFRALQAYLLSLRN